MTLQKRESAFMETAIDDDRVLMHLDTGHFHTLSGVGLAIWDMIDGSRTLTDLQTVMANRHAVDRTRCEVEVAAFVDELVQAGFVDAR